MVSQSTAGIKAHSGVEGERSHDGVLADDIQGVTDGEEDSGALGADGEQMGPSHSEGFGIATELQRRPLEVQPGYRRAEAELK